MTTREKMVKGLLYVDGDDGLPEERIRCKNLIYDYNLTRPCEEERREELLRAIFGSVGKTPFIDPPMHMAYGNRVRIGDYFYANFNLVIVDDIEVTIGDHVMFAPNVTISVTGHPVDPMLRRDGTQFSKTVHIGNDVWIGAGAVILPGVAIGDGSVIGAGSIVTRDIPPQVVAVGNPCRVLRPIDERDWQVYQKERSDD